MLTRLQRKTLIPAQLIGYALTLLIGVSILLLAFQAYSDIKRILTEQTDVFDTHAVVVSKSVSSFSTFNKNNIYFSDEELDAFRKQDFVKEIATFKGAKFAPSLGFQSHAVGYFQTDVFFESIDDRFIDVKTEDWKWDSEERLIPIIVPKDFLNLYNFCFAESQSMPVLTEKTIQSIPLSIVLEGNGKREQFTGRLVGFSDKIKTILVPESFMEWANAAFGHQQESKVNRLLVEFRNANDKRIPAYLDEHGYVIDESELDYSKMSFFFNVGLIFVLVIAIVIILLSMAFIVMSLNLIIQRNRKMLINLYNIGYTPARIARFYQLVVSVITILDILLAVIVTLHIRSAYLELLSEVFRPIKTAPLIGWCSAGLLLLLLFVYNLIIRRNIRKTVKA